MKEIKKLLESLTGSKGLHEVWQDVVQMSAIAISNCFDKKNFEKREKEYILIAKKYKPDEVEKISKIFALIVKELDKNPYQDFLGKLYMTLELGSKAKGQFFTPYSICEAMAQVTGIPEGEKDWISVLEPSAGGGANLIAFANECRKKRVNYQRDVLFVAQELDYTTALICYIQCSLLGMPGYIKIGDTLANPVAAYDRKHLIPVDDGGIWYFPMYFSDLWQLRKLSVLAEEVEEHND